MVKTARLLGLLTLLPMLLIAPSAALAKIYVCKDSAGNTLTADRPLPECADRVVRELDTTGITRREIAPPLTPEQKRERQRQEVKQRAIAAEMEERRLYDRALMTRYRNLSDIAIARQRAVSLMEDQMRIDTDALPNEMKEMKAAQAVAATMVNSKSGVAPMVQRRLDEAARMVDLRLSSIESRTAEIERVNKKFDQAVKRFSEIKSALDVERGTEPLR